MSYPKLYQKSILFEILNIKNPSEIVSAFTLTIPPDQFEVVQSQRISRTKTFGGVFVDDYGLDVAKITISGTTGNSELRATYIPGRGGGLEQYTGKMAIYAFRDKIARYKNLLAGKGFESYEMRMYDLSTVPDAGSLEMVQDSATDGWVVSLDDFKISRSKERPLWYNYSIDLVGIYPLPSPRTKPPQVMDPIPDPTGAEALSSVSNELNTGEAPVIEPKNKDWLQDAIGAIRRCVNAVKGAYSWTTDLLGDINNVFTTLSDLEDLVVEYIHASGTILTAGFGFYQKMFEIARFPGAVAVATMEEVNRVMDSVEGAMEFTAAIPETLGDDWDYVYQLCEETKRIAARITVFGKSQQSDSEVTVSIGGRSVTVYGTITTTATASTTLEKLAAQYYGDPSMAQLIAMFNGITDEDIYPGMTIRIPQTVRSPQTEANRIYSWDKMSNYGVDIAFAHAVHSVRMVIAESGDFAYVSGKDNLLQAVNLRLNEKLGKRLRLTVYGLTMSFGSARASTAPIGYIITNLQDTLKQDPRIKSVDSIKLLGQGDKLNVTFNIGTIEDQVLYEGVI